MKVYAGLFCFCFFFLFLNANIPGKEIPSTSTYLFVSIYAALTSVPRNSDYFNVILPGVTPLSERWSDEPFFASKYSREPFTAFLLDCGIICGL